MGSMNSKTYFMETAESIASHHGQHPSFAGHTQDWYKAMGFGENCPTCGIERVFEEIKGVEIG